MKIITYNVNGIRAAMKKGLVEWIIAQDADIVCLQEVKALEEQADLETLKANGFEHIYWHAAEKKGYSGVATFSKKAADHVQYGIGIASHDSEGRFLQTRFGDFVLINSYFPSGTTGDIRQDVKYQYLHDYFDYIQELKKTNPNIITCGDVNICHTAIDIHNPKTNKNSSGFLPEERAWMDKLFSSGYVDAFRVFNPEKVDQYSWWSYRANARANNKGWRIDYFMVADTLKDRLKGCEIHPEAKHSDHCPVVLEL